MEAINSMIQNRPFWDKDELEEVGYCPVCSSAKNERLYHDIHDKLEGIPGEWSIWRCKGCDSTYLNPRPSLDSIGKAYATKTYFTHADTVRRHADDNGTSFIWRMANGYLNSHYNANRKPASAFGNWLIPLLSPIRLQLDYFFRCLPMPQPGTRKLLDIGCGNGAFLLRAKQAGWDAHGIEPDPAAVESAHAAGLHVIEGRFEAVAGNNDFDIVTSSHVIEHVHDPLALLIAIKTHLRPGGRLWLATPNIRSIGHLLFESAWLNLDPPRHLQILSRSGLILLLSKAGLEDIRFHRRGRGARVGFELSREFKCQMGQRPPWISHLFVDMLATLSSHLSEELVVTARKPSE
jgi:2-polyprenyl-3-methyl-5-hydroxy-6-metoxy-1,4-benzoquinol methylase